MDRATPFLEGNFYHIYNRGVDKRKIFYRPNDYAHFQRLLYTRNGTKRIDSTRVKGFPLHKITRGETIVDIVAYCLMPNHFHLLLHEKQNGGISTFMNKLGTAFAMYMNTKYDRTGPIMCRPFRSKYVESDEYLQWLLCYIHLNPVEQREGQDEQNFLDQYKFSSYVDYKSEDNRDEGHVLNRTALPYTASAVSNLSISSMKAVPPPM